MIIKYKAKKIIRFSIERVEFERETSHSLWDKSGRQCKKMTDYESYFDSFEEAKAHLIEICHDRIKSAQLKMAIAKESLKEAEELKP